jgi:hypothetical protein
LEQGFKDVIDAIAAGGSHYLLRQSMESVEAAALYDVKPYISMGSAHAAKGVISRWVLRILHQETTA